MARVTMRHEWPDGGVTSVSVTFEDSYPDAMARAVDETLRCWDSAVTEDAGDADVE
jgi:hypothetical protein